MQFSSKFYCKDAPTRGYLWCCTSSGTSGTLPPYLLYLVWGGHGVVVWDEEVRYLGGHPLLSEVHGHKVTRPPVHGGYQCVNFSLEQGVPL